MSLRRIPLLSPSSTAPVALLLLIFYLCGVLPAVEGSFLTTEELEKSVCYSRVAGFVSKVTVTTMPNFPVDILLIPGQHKKFLITCMSTTESGPTLAPSQIGLCSTPAVLSVCSAPASTPTAWTCNAVPQYQKDVASQIVLGGQDEPEKKFKIQWTPQSSGVVCFPRDLTFQFVGHSVLPEESNTAANVAFIIIVAVVLILVGLFGSYQLKKVLRKFWKKQKSRPTTHLTEQEQRNTVTAVRGGVPKKSRPPGPVKPRAGPDIYDEDIVVSSGQQYAIIEDGTVELHAQPMPKPWYQRVEYDLDKKKQLPGSDDYQDDEGNLTPKGRRSRSRHGAPESIIKSPKSADRRARGHGLSTPTGREQSSSHFVDMYGEEEEDTYDDSYYGGGGDASEHRMFAHGSDRVGHGRPLHRYDADSGRPVDDAIGAVDEDIVLTCTDCLMPIRGPSTPQYCPVTGKRHY